MKTLSYKIQNKKVKAWVQRKDRQLRNENTVMSSSSGEVLIYFA